MKIVTALALLCLMGTTAHAGEPWPANVCATLANYEQKDSKVSEGWPMKLAFARSNVLHMLRNHCGVDITAKEAADVAAVSGPSYSGGGGGGGSGEDRGTDVEIDMHKPSMHCTTMSLGGGMSSTDCE